MLCDGGWGWERSGAKHLAGGDGLEKVVMVKTAHELGLRRGQCEDSVRERCGYSRVASSG